MLTRDIHTRSISRANERSICQASSRKRRTPLRGPAQDSRSSSRVLAVIPALVALSRRGRQPEEHELRDASAALQTVAAGVLHREKTFATTGIAGVPDRAVDRYAGPKQVRARPQQGHEVVRQVHLLAVRDHV